MEIVAVGHASLASTNVFVLARLNSNGLLDDTFDGPGGSGNGVFRISQGTNAFAAAIAVSGNKVIFGGSVDAHSFVYQLNDNGTLDTTGFGSPNGYLTFDFPGAAAASRSLPDWRSSRATARSSPLATRTVPPG